ncbi:MAG: GHKL domain-containing protein [Clostridia bacterium]|nr:GHKL domain-containing protein [Clostridia bacterium]
MEILQTIWTTLTTPNETLSAILFFPFYFVDVLVNMLLFTTILNIKTTRKRKIIYVIILGILACIIRNFIPDPYSVLSNFVIMFALIKVVLKTTFLKSLLAEFIGLSISSVFELFMLRLYFIVFKLPYDMVMTTPFYRIIFTLSIYLCVYLLYKMIHYFKFYIDLGNMTRKNKILFFINTSLGIVSIVTQFYLIIFYSDTMPTGIIITSILSLLAYFFISIYSLLSTDKLNTTSQSLEEAQLYNKTLILLHDNMRGFKHDFHNIVQGLGGYIDRGDLEGLQKYYKQLLQDCNRVNNLTALSPSVINNPAIYNVMAAKYHRADEIGIQINLGIFMDLNEFENHMKIYEFTRILGILMDNAIEAALECNDKIIHVTFRKEDSRHRFLMVIENTYLHKDIDTERIFEKSYSTKSKKTNSGLGLWEVRQILKRNNNLNLFTTKDSEYFRQQLEIYY